jgi:hypothetical protein
VKPAALIFAVMLLCSSCGRWSPEQTKAAFDSIRLPAYVVSGISSLDGYGEFWLIDADGKIIKVEGRGLYFSAGKAIERPAP